MDILFALGSCSATLVYYTLFVCVCIGETSAVYIIQEGGSKKIDRSITSVQQQRFSAGALIEGIVICI